MTALALAGVLFLRAAWAQEAAKAEPAAEAPAAGEKVTSAFLPSVRRVKRSFVSKSGTETTALALAGNDA